MSEHRWITHEPGSYALMHPNYRDVAIGTVQQFYEDGPYYAGWIGIDGEWHRSGAMTSFVECRARVEREILPLTEH